MSKSPNKDWVEGFETKWTKQKRELVNLRKRRRYYSECFEERQKDAKFGREIRICGG